MQPFGFMTRLRAILGKRAPPLPKPLKAPVLPKVVPKDCPLLDAALVAWVDWAIPPYDPQPTDGLQELMFRAGQRAVVNKLRHELARQQARAKDL